MGSVPPLELVSSFSSSSSGLDYRLRSHHRTHCHHRTHPQDSQRKCNRRNRIYVKSRTRIWCLRKAVFSDCSQEIVWCHRLRCVASRYGGSFWLQDFPLKLLVAIKIRALCHPGPQIQIRGNQVLSKSWRWGPLNTSLTWNVRPGNRWKYFCSCSGYTSSSPEKLHQ